MIPFKTIKSKLLNNTPNSINFFIKNYFTKMIYSSKSKFLYMYITKNLNFLILKRFNNHIYKKIPSLKTLKKCYFYFKSLNYIYFELNTIINNFNAQFLKKLAIRKILKKLEYIFYYKKIMHFYKLKNLKYSKMLSKYYKLDYSQLSIIFFKLALLLKKKINLKNTNSYFFDIYFFHLDLFIFFPEFHEIFNRFNTFSLLKFTFLRIYVSWFKFICFIKKKNVIIDFSSKYLSYNKLILNHCFDISKHLIVSMQTSCKYNYNCLIYLDNYKDQKHVFDLYNYLNRLNNYNYTCNLFALKQLNVQNNLILIGFFLKKNQLKSNQSKKTIICIISNFLE